MLKNQMENGEKPWNGQKNIGHIINIKYPDVVKIVKTVNNWIY